MKKAIHWIAEHDSKTIFIVLYIGISLVLSIAISLFWLLFAVLIHLLLEIIAQSTKKQGTWNIMMESLWETKLDFGLVVFALWLSVYLDFIFGIAGLGAAARGGAQASAVGGRAAQAGARFAAWNRIIRIVLLSLDDVGNGIKAMVTARKSKKSKIRQERIANQQAKANDAKKEKKAEEASQKAEQKQEESDDPTKTSWTGKWAVVDYIGLFLFLICALAVVFAPQLIDKSWESIIKIIAEEFHPLPFFE